MSAKTGKTYTNVSEEDFKQIKLLLSAGLSKSQIHQITKGSEFTIGFIDKAKDHNNYRNLIKVYVKGQEAKRLAKLGEPTPAVSTTKPTSTSELDILAVLTNVNEVLNRLDERLMWVEENVEVRTKKKLWG